MNSDAKEANIKRAINLISKIATLVAIWDRIRKGNEPVAPLGDDANHATIFLYMLTNEMPSKEESRI